MVTGNPTIMDRGLFATRTESVATTNIGAEVRDQAGNAYRYAKAGGSNISRGKLQLAPAPKTNHDNCAVAAAAAIGATQVTVTLGATAAVANEYSEGVLIVNDGTGEGLCVKISGHPAADASASLVVSLIDPLPVALDTTSEVCLFHNSYNGVVEGTSSTQRPAGVPMVDIAAGDYGWLQVSGIASVLADETLTLGAQLTAGTSVAGAVEEYDDTGSAPQTDNMVGWAVVAGVDTEYRPVLLAIV